MANPLKPRPQSTCQVRLPTSNFHDGDLELRRQQDLKKNNSRTSKSGFDWLWQTSGILGSWMNNKNAAGKFGMEAFWPTSLDKECDKCARILYTFTQRGLDGTMNTTIEEESEEESEDMNESKKREELEEERLKKVPTQVIQQAEGLAIFTVFRSEPGWNGASGSGIVIARDSPTTWGAPSGILIHTMGVGLLAGIDVYDAVLVLRTQKAVAAFSQPKVSLGAELAVLPGPIGNCVSFESGPELSPVFSYTKSKGIYGGLQLDGNIIIERTDENARFYGRKVKAQQILQGGAVAVPRAASGLIAVIDAAEGKAYDREDLPDQIDISPSEESNGVSTISESRAKAAAEHGIVEEVLDEENSNSSSFKSDPNWHRRRTLPPMALHQEHEISSNNLNHSRDLILNSNSANSFVESTSNQSLKEEDENFELGHEPEEQQISEEVEKEEEEEEEEGSIDLSQEEPERIVELTKEQEPPIIEAPAKSNPVAAAPPPPPRRRVVPPLPTPADLSNDSTPTPTPVATINQNHSPVDLPLSQSPPHPVPPLTLHSFNPPEPFQLHERSTSDLSTSTTET